MKSGNLILLLSAVLCIGSSSWNTALAQDDYSPSAVTVSKEKVKSSDGKTYYSHVVLERQTLYSIAKAYGVSVDDIYAANPELKEKGLKKNTVILVPLKGSSQKSSEKSGTASSKKVTPAKPASTETASGTDDYFIHVVKWYENIDDIATKYGIPAEEILQYNGIPAGKKIKNRTKLKIPRQRKVAAPVPEKKVEEEKKEEAPVVKPKSEDDEPEEPLSATITRKDHVDAALLLPMGASDKISTSTMDFYSGFLMALKELGEEGVKCNLNVYDVAGEEFPSSEKLNANDIVIGPITPEDIKKTLSKTKVPVVSILDQATAPLAWKKRNFVMGPVCAYSQYKDLVKWIKEDFHSGDKIILATDRTVKESPAARQMDSLLTDAGLKYSIVQWSNGGSAALESLLMASGTNRVLINAENQSFSTEIAKALNKSDARIVAYAPSKMKSHSIASSILGGINLHCAASYYLNYGDAKTKNFILKYRGYFDAEPSQFAFQGYDMCNYYITLVNKYGKQWARRALDKNPAHGLQADFAMGRIADKGFYNSAPKRLIYEGGGSIRVVK